MMAKEITPTFLDLIITWPVLVLAGVRVDELLAPTKEII